MIYSTKRAKPLRNEEAYVKKKVIELEQNIGDENSDIFQDYLHYKNEWEKYWKNDIMLLS